MAFFNSFLGGLQQDQDLSPLAALLGRRRNAAEPSSPVPAYEPAPQEEMDIPVQGKNPRTGMFGIKGTFRDILGTLGDALSEGTGGKAIYRPRRDQERYADALGDDLTDNPMNSISRLQEAGFGAEANKLAQQVFENEIAKAKAASDSSYKQAQITEQGYKNLGNLFTTADERSFPALLEIAKRRAASYGIDPGELPTDLAGAKRWGLDPYRANRLDQFAEEQQLRERNVSDQISDRAARRGLTVRGQDISAATRRANNAASIAAADRRAAMADKRVRESAGFSGSRRNRARTGSTTGSSTQGGWTVKRID